MKVTERRKGEPRVIFDRPLDVRVMTIDGTWAGESVLIEMTNAGARLKVTGRATELTDFFLILNSSALRYSVTARERGSTAIGWASVSTSLTSELKLSK